jgi:6-phospho-beta-glucosidase
VRTPLLIYGLAQSGLAIGELATYDLDTERARVMAGLGRELSSFQIRVHDRIETAVEGAQFVLSSIRVGGISARARDERIALEHGLAGQETTGPGGLAMALRTVPVAIAQARVVEKFAPQAWLINFTNPAGLITQALTTHTGVRAIGICDTPAELFHRIGEALGGRVECDYAGLNHLGWVRRVWIQGQDVTARLLADDGALRSLYPADLFDPELIRALGLIPSEYLFFYYSQRKAYTNQERAGTTRGAEIERMNAGLFEQLRGPDPIRTYRNYLAQRNASYLKLEAGSGAGDDAAQQDPFETATGYHRIAIEVMQALSSDEPRRVVVNVPNCGAIPDLADEDVVEVPCSISCAGAVPEKTGALPESVRGLVESVKAYERTAIRAAVERSAALAHLAMLECPIIGDWELAVRLRKALLGDLGPQMNTDEHR